MSSVVCDLCGGPSTFWVETRETAEYPASRVFACQRCGHVMWKKSAPVQQQQQQQPQKKE